MGNRITKLIQDLSGEILDNSYEASDALAVIGSEEVVNEVLKLLAHPHADNRHLAARTLSKIEKNQAALEPLMEVIHNKENVSQAGELLATLDGFDVSSKYVDIFKLYLFGSFKVSMIAKELLDYKEFDITPRVLKKSLKHWNHYTNNVKQDEVYQLRKIEVEEMLNDIKVFINE